MYLSDKLDEEGFADEMDLPPTTLHGSKSAPQLGSEFLADEDVKTALSRQSKIACRMSRRQLKWRWKMKRVQSMDRMCLLTQLRTLEKAKILYYLPLLQKLHSNVNQQCLNALEMLNAENVEIHDLVNKKVEDAETKQTAEPPQDGSDADNSQTTKRLDSEHSSKDTSAEPESGPAPQHLSRLHSASFSSGIWDAHGPPACERGFAWLIFKPVPSPSAWSGSLRSLSQSLDANDEQAVQLKELKERTVFLEKQLRICAERVRWMEDSKKQGEFELMTLKEEINEANRRDQKSTGIIGKLIELVRPHCDLPHRSSLSFSKWDVSHILALPEPSTCLFGFVPAFSDSTIASFVRRWVRSTNAARWERITAIFSTQLDVRVDIHIAISTRPTIDTKRLRVTEKNANRYGRQPSASHAQSSLDLHTSVHPGKEWLMPFGEEDTAERGEGIRPQRLCIPSKPSGCNGESQTPQKSADDSPHLEDTTTACVFANGMCKQCDGRGARPVSISPSPAKQKRRFRKAGILVSRAEDG
ncbi:hypothetical protein BLNAU_17170 [Blattamonas nauphoetae]|uniref:Uncharacterized protein n=1 Tax=Blattamonas nauphoetae TaxID=2049346 RepID=A0ABQ9X9L6_9EUKA|nr:hypothetical protein BLNAU_17170 [Blattamonas nauphoetae]